MKIANWTRTGINEIWQSICDIGKAAWFGWILVGVLFAALFMGAVLGDK